MKIKAKPNTCGPGPGRSTGRKSVRLGTKDRTHIDTVRAGHPIHTYAQRLLPFCSILLCAPLFMRLVNLVVLVLGLVLVLGVGLLPFLLLFSHFPADCRQHISQIAVKVLRKLTRLGLFGAAVPKDPRMNSNWKLLSQPLAFRHTVSSTGCVLL